MRWQAHRQTCDAGQQLRVRMDGWGQPHGQNFNRTVVQEGNGLMLWRVDTRRSVVYDGKAGSHKTRFEASHASTRQQ